MKLYLMLTVIFWGSAHAADSHHWCSLISMGFQGCSLIFIEFSWIFIDFHWCLLNVHWFSLIFNEFSLIFIDFHWFSLIFDRCSMIFNGLSRKIVPVLDGLGRPSAPWGWVFMPKNYCFAWGFLPIGAHRRPLGGS